MALFLKLLLVCSCMTICNGCSQTMPRYFASTDWHDRAEQMQRLVAETIDLFQLEEVIIKVLKIIAEDNGQSFVVPTFEGDCNGVLDKDMHKIANPLIVAIYTQRIYCAQQCLEKCDIPENSIQITCNFEGNLLSFESDELKLKCNCISDNHLCALKSVYLDEILPGRLLIDILNLIPTSTTFSTKTIKGLTRSTNYPYLVAEYFTDQDSDWYKKKEFLETAKWTVDCKYAETEISDLISGPYCSNGHPAASATRIFCGNYCSKKCVKTVESIECLDGNSYNGKNPEYIHITCNCNSREATCPPLTERWTVIEDFAIHRCTKMSQEKCNLVGSKKMSIYYNDTCYVMKAVSHSIKQAQEACQVNKYHCGNLGFVNEKGLFSKIYSRLENDTEKHCFWTSLEHKYGVKWEFVNNGIHEPIDCDSLIWNIDRCPTDSTSENKCACFDVQTKSYKLVEEDCSTEKSIFICQYGSEPTNYI